MAEPLLKPSAAPAIEIVIENQARFNQAIERAKEAMRDLTLPLTQIGLMLYKSQRSIFQLSGPGLYPDLTAGYKKAKARRFGFTYPILKATGRLEASTTDPGDSDTVMRIENRETLYWGTKVPYGIYHQAEGARKRRPFLIWTAESRYAPDLASSRVGRAMNILNYHALRALGKDIGPTGGEG